MTLQLSPAEIQFALRNLDLLDPDQKAQVLRLVEEREKLSELNEARRKFIPFVKAMWPGVIIGAHHEIMAEAFEELIFGKLNRLIINIAPRHGKSEMTSWLLPLWYLGLNPRSKIMQCMNSQDLAAGFGRRVRNSISKEAIATETKGDDPYHEIFPNMDLAKDSGAANHWHDITGSEYYAVGTGGRIAGRGASLLVIDDPHSEQEAKLAESNPAVFDQVYDWYVYGPRQRLQPNAKICVVQTRWSKRDLTGRLLKKMQEDESVVADKWRQIELPAILDEGTETERSLWPGYWPLETLQATRAALPIQAWESQYQQNPTSVGASIFKKEYWRTWGDDAEKCPGPQHVAAWANGDPPACKYILQSWDAAATKTERGHPSAFTEWGIFDAEDPDTGKTTENIILLSAFDKRMEFPELKQTAKEFYEDTRPDTLLIENKSAGMQLIQEFVSMGLPVESFNGSSRGRSTGVRGTGSNDKIARANSVVDVFASRFVWKPARRFADVVVEQMFEFPSGSADDYVDSAVQAMIRFRAGGLIRTQHDVEEEDGPSRFRRRRMY